MELFRNRSEFKVNFIIELKRYKYFKWLMLKMSLKEYVISSIMYSALVISYIRLD